MFGTEGKLEDLIHGKCYVTEFQEGGKISGQFVNLMLDKLDELKADLETETVSGQFKEKQDELERLKNKKRAELNKLEKEYVTKSGEFRQRRNELEAMAEKFKTSQHFVADHLCCAAGDPKGTREEIRKLARECKDLMLQGPVKEKLKSDKSPEVEEVQMLLKDLERLMASSRDANEGQNVEDANEAQVVTEDRNLQMDDESKYHTVKRFLMSRKGLLAIISAGIVLYVASEAHSFSQATPDANGFGPFLTQSQTVRYALVLLMIICILWYRL